MSFVQEIDDLYKARRLLHGEAVDPHCGEEGD